MNGDFLTLRDVANRLRIGYSTASKLVNSPYGPKAKRIGKRLLRFDKVEFEAWLDRQDARPQQAA